MAPERALMEILGGDLLPRAGLCRKGRKGGLGAGNLLESCRVLSRFFRFMGGRCRFNGIDIKCVQVLNNSPENSKVCILDSWSLIR